MKVIVKTCGACNFDKIWIPKSFKESPPKLEKVIEKTLKFSRESELEDILVDEDFCLIDGYCSYLIAQQVGPAFVKIKMVTKPKKRRRKIDVSGIF